MSELRSDLMLSPYRILDLTDRRGLLCGKMLGDLGAEVVAVEKPGGNPARKAGPFYHDIVSAEKSLFWFAFSTDKRSITLDIETEDGKALFKRLIKTADAVVESFVPGYLDGIGLGYSVLSAINPRIIMTSITPFGQTGPYKDFKAPDIVVMAMSGYMYVLGDPDRSPVRVSFPQAYFHAASEAAVGTMAALTYRESSGQGQQVDVSAQQSVAWSTQDVQLWWDMCRVNIKRAGAVRKRPTTGVTFPVIWPCKDGYVAFMLLGGRVGATSQRALVNWMDAEGMAPDILKKTDWDAFDWATLTQGQVDPVKGYFDKFFMAHTRKELFDGAIKHRVMLYPVGTAESSLDSAQLASRGYWRKIEHPELGETLTYPGPYVKMSETPLRVNKRAPLIGEDNLAIYEKELGLTRDQLTTLKEINAI